MILGIYGAGGLGREVYELANIINDQDKRWDEFVFIDDADVDLTQLKIPVYKFEEIIEQFKTTEIEFCIAVGEPSIRKIIFDKIMYNGFKVATLIYPGTVIADSTKIGNGVIICRYVSITCDITIGQNAYIQPFVCIGHDATIGENTVISSFVVVAGDCHIGSNSYIAISVCLRQGITIGNETIVGMASVVNRDLPDNVIALGNPARPMKMNEDHKVFR